MTTLDNYLSTLLSDGEVVLIVPPFAIVNRPSLGVHILQACAHQVGIRVNVLYANLIFAAEIGLKDYMTLCNAPFHMLWGERLFAATAYGIPPLRYDANQALKDYVLPDAHFKDEERLESKFNRINIKARTLSCLAGRVEHWVNQVAAAVAAQNIRVVGCTTMCEQTAASAALLNHIKHLCPDITTIIGGSNCEGEMAEGIASLSGNIDYVFSGESEKTFVEFLQSLYACRRPLNRIICGAPLCDLDALPPPDFHQYYEQINNYLPAVAAKPYRLQLAYETSRGCWWGEKHQCAFCGFNGIGIGFREKSPEKVISELECLLATYPARSVQMTDNIMPHTFFKTLAPQLARLAQKTPALKIFYEQKANLSLEQILVLIKAGISHIQPGIEALSTSLLKRMNKGVTAAQNIALLRYTRSAGMSVEWNLLWGFPGDTLAEYLETLALLPMLHHLAPPLVFSRLRLDRFSPCFDTPETYGIKNIQPWPSYKMILPPDVAAAKVAYLFKGDYECDADRHPKIIYAIAKEVVAWQRDWETKISLFFGTFKLKDVPLLQVTSQPDGRYLLRDTRHLPGTQEEYMLTHEQSSVALIPRPYQPTPEIEWALDHKVGVVLDTRHYVPLATANPELLLELMADVRKRREYAGLSKGLLTIEKPAL